MYYDLLPLIHDQYSRTHHSHQLLLTKLTEYLKMFFLPFVAYVVRLIDQIINIQRATLIHNISQDICALFERLRSTKRVHIKILHHCFLWIKIFIIRLTNENALMSAPQNPLSGLYFYVIKKLGETGQDTFSYGTL